MSAEDGKGIDIKGTFTFVSSAKTDDPDLVIAKLAFEKKSRRLFLKLNISKSILFFYKKMIIDRFDWVSNVGKL